MVYNHYNKLDIDKTGTSSSSKKRKVEEEVPEDLVEKKEKLNK
jgi:hypothetical protein